MKEYKKPFIEEEDIKIEDICSVSNRGVLNEFEDETDADGFFK